MSDWMAKPTEHGGQTTPPIEGDIDYFRGLGLDVIVVDGVVMLNDPTGADEPDYLRTPQMYGGDQPALHPEYTSWTHPANGPNIATGPTINVTMHGMSPQDFMNIFGQGGASLGSAMPQSAFMGGGGLAMAGIEASSNPQLDTGYAQRPPTTMPDDRFTEHEPQSNGLDTDIALYNDVPVKRVKDRGRAVIAGAIAATFLAVGFGGPAVYNGVRNDNVPDMNFWQIVTGERNG